VATSDRFYAATYSNEREVFSIWSSVDGRSWAEEHLDGTLQGNGPEPTLGVNDDVVIVFAGFGRSFVGAPGEELRRIDDLYASGDDMQLVGGDGGFVLLGASGFGDGNGIYSVGPYVSINGLDWVPSPIDGAQVGGSASAMVGQVVLVPTGSWEVEFAGNEVASESWEQDGGWVLGRLIPAG
jgi:hypothetical protein